MKKDASGRTKKGPRAAGAPPGAPPWRGGRGLSRFLALLLVLLVLSGCDYARMTYQEAVNTFQTRKPLAKMPVMVRGTIPVDGGLEELRKVNIATLHNPLPSTPETIADGKLRYSYYCIQCHGPKADGCGTVGQSFAPLPTDLRTDDVQGESDGSLFYKISMGFLRHPPLSATIAVRDRWAIITYLRSHDLRAW